MEATAEAKVAWRSCVTTSRQARSQEEEVARALAAELGVPFEPRRQSLDHWLAGGQYEAVLVVNREHLTLWVARAGRQPKRLFFHPSTSVQRVKGLLRGGSDPMVRAMGLEPGMSVLDATVGVGSDAIVASFVVGPQGRVVGLESVRELAALTRWGMAHYQGPIPAVEEAMRRIEILHTDHGSFLAQAEAKSFDVIYFDPMFRDPVAQSAPMAPWRLLADPRPVTPEVIAQARRVARRRVVLKERKGSPVFEELGAQHVEGRRSGRVAYGIWEALP